MTVVKKVTVSIFVTVIALVAVSLLWTALPVSPEQNKPDPTVIYANSQIAWGPHFTESYFEYEGNSLHYVEAGQGELVLFLHGFPSYWYSLIRPMQALKNEYRVVAIDGLGKGLSDVSTDIDDYKFAKLEKHIVQLIEHLGEEKVHLVGHDIGHSLAFDIASVYPEKVLSVTGMSAPPISVMLELVKTNSEQREIFSYVDYFKKSHPILLAALDIEKRIYEGSFKPLVDAGHLSAEDGVLFRNEASNPKKIHAHINWYKANIPSYDDITDDKFWPTRKARVEVPYLFIWGTESPVVNQDTVTELKSVTNDFVELKLEGVGHRPQFEAPEIVIDAIQKHLVKHPNPDKHIGLTSPVVGHQNG